MSSSVPAPGRRRTDAGSEWRRHPVLSLAVRAAVYSLPVAAGLTVSLVLSRSLGHPIGLMPTLAWFAAVVVATLLTVISVERLVRRLLPLATLLNLSLLFPDQAPRRFAVARRRGNPGDLERALQVVRAAGTRTPDAGYMQAILELIEALNTHDKRTRGHSQRVRVFTDLIAEEMRLPAVDRARLRWASMLHDIGKLMVPAEVLNKPGALRPEDWELIHRHPAEGGRLIEPIKPWLGRWAGTVEHHHERWDGGGYPLGLSGERICLGARIVAVADAFETMTTARPYSRPIKVTAARAELVRCAGKQFDPVVVRAFLNISIGRCWREVGVASLLAQVPAAASVGNLLSQLGALAPAVATGVAAVPLMLGPLAPPGQVAGPADPPPVSAALQGDPPTIPAAPTADPARPGGRATPTPTPTSSGSSATPTPTTASSGGPGATSSPTPAGAGGGPTCPAQTPASAGNGKSSQSHGASGSQAGCPATPAASPTAKPKGRQAGTPTPSPTAGVPSPTATPHGHSSASPPGKKKGQ
ncbi:MAG TPA: HD domain-containing phosphohydrolase [Candidatus Binatia bacterium]|nr:HD domain-containing phosphohydrolase [Candidatus Binatia bacterium]